VTQPELQPQDEYNKVLLANVHPAGWRNPEPAGRYNLVVIGAGTAGLVTAAGAAGLGARVALVERHLMGGDCLNVGCVPSKAILHSAHAVAALRDAPALGIHAAPAAAASPQVDFARVMERMREIRSRISANDSVQRFRDELGVDVFLGEARFAGGDRIEVAGGGIGAGETNNETNSETNSETNNRTLRFKRAVIATGARPVVPPIPGLAEAGYYTNESIFDLTELPTRMLVIGAGPIGCELSQAFRRFGSEVMLVEQGPQFLPREDPEAAELLRAALERDGLDLRLDTRVSEVEVNGDGKRITLERDGKKEGVDVDAILVGVGRAPNVLELGLDEAGVAFDRNGVEVDDHLRTTNPRIYAAGDVCMRHKFTHAADFAARSVIQNALFAVGPFGRKKLSALSIPWCTYTQPEIAHVGLYEHEAAERGTEVETFVRQLGDVDRAITEGEEEGFVKILVGKGSDRILGATIVARNAGDMISEVSVAMAGGVGLSALASVIHPYPTQAEAIRQVGDAYNRTRLTPALKRLFAGWLALRR